MSYTFRAGDLPKLDLDVDRGSDFLAWEKQWNSYMILSGLADSAAPIKVHALHCCLSRDTLTIVDNLGLTEAQRGDQEQIVAALKSYVQGRVNETVERRNFRQRKQALGESFDDYLLSLRELAKTCNFCDNNCLRSNIRDQLVTGLIDPDTIKYYCIISFEVVLYLVKLEILLWFSIIQHEPMLSGQLKYALIKMCVCGGCVFGSGPEVPEFKPNSGNFPSASHHPHQSTQLCDWVPGICWV